MAAVETALLDDHPCALHEQVLVLRHDLHDRHGNLLSNTSLQHGRTAR
jgi:hypothetical protein